jgi:hypothetical protein
MKKKVSKDEDESYVPLNNNIYRYTVESVVKMRMESGKREFMVKWKVYLSGNTSNAPSLGIFQQGKYLGNRGKYFSKLRGADQYFL